MFDSNLAALNRVELRSLNQAVKRNMGRFPVYFMFHLTDEEWNFLRSQIVTSNSLALIDFAPAMMNRLLDHVISRTSGASFGSSLQASKNCLIRHEQHDH